MQDERLLEVCIRCMEARLRRTICLLLMIFAGSINAARTVGDERCEIILENAINNYRIGSYTRSLNELESITHTDDRDLLVQTYTYIALNYVAIGDISSAIEHFKLAISIDPDLEVDPAIATPEIMKVLEEAKSEKAHESAGCSCFIPGIGQFMKGENSKARAIIAASGASLSATIIAWAISDSKRNYYLSLGPSDIDKMDDAYNAYDRWRKVSFISAAAFVGVYVYNIFDAIISRKPAKGSGTKEKAGLKIEADGNTISVNYEIGL